MREYLAYFFGSGSDVEFAIFTPAHFAPILVMLAVIYLIYRNRNAIRESRYEETFRYVLAFALIIAEMSYYWRLSAVESLYHGPVENLPIGVCGWAVIFCSYMLVGKKQQLFDIVYFWLLSGCIFALLTPTPLTYTGPTRFRYYQFWAAHTLGYVAIFYMIFVHGMRPYVRSAIRSYASLTCMTVIAYGVNQMIPGANYLYMARPEAAPSVLDILPPNFLLRILVMISAITLMYGLAYLPWYRKDKREKSTV